MSRILIVEDSDPTRWLLEMWLRDSGHQIQHVGLGHEAADVVEAWRPDLVLLDMTLPGMDGYEVAAEIRAREQAAQKPRTSIVAITSHAIPGDEERALKAGCDAYMEKPVGREAFLRMVDLQLRRDT